MGRLRQVFLMVAAFLLTISAGAHPMPNSVLLLDIKGNGVAAELQWPLKEFQLVFPGEDIDVHPERLLQRKGAWLEAYLHQHMSVTDSYGHAWTIAVNSKQVTTAQQDMTGSFHELIFKLWLQAPAGISPRHFTIHYDAIMHQLVTHKMFVAIREDWDGGLNAKDSADADLGLLMMDPASNKVPPLIVNLDAGGKWIGFKNMVQLGIAHIAEGTDHLLFLFVLLLPAPLLVVAGRRWGGSGSTRYAIVRLLRITIAFTIGHSLTLLAGALGWVRLPQQPVEMLIALSILIGAVHALKPIFPGKEAFVAAGFGLVHGLAFASTLINFHLDGVRTALTILGFNLGIELMQLFVVFITVPWLIILSGYKVYRAVRIGGGILAIVAATAWLVERATQKPNLVSSQLEQLSKHGNWLVLGLAVLALGCYCCGGIKRGSSAV